jgi:hypothetical protein
MSVFAQITIQEHLHSRGNSQSGLFAQGHLHNTLIPACTHRQEISHPILKATQGSKPKHDSK